MSSYLFGFSNFVIVKYDPRIKGFFSKGRHTSVVRQRAKIFSFLVVSFLFFFARMSEGVRDWRQRKGGGENPFGAAAAAEEEEDDEEVVEGLGTKRKGEEERETGQK